VRLAATQGDVDGLQLDLSGEELVVAVAIEDGLLVVTVF
jgi:hypothetical protein